MDISMVRQDPLAGHATYESIRPLGRGRSTFVYLARNRSTDEQVAIKFTPRGWDATSTKNLTREIINHQELSLSHHPHITEFREVFITPQYLAIVMESVEGEPLQVFLEKVGGHMIEGLARFLFQQLIIAVDFCHRKGKINRDIKLTNILLALQDGQLPLLKLCDFGFSKDTYRSSAPRSQVGSALYVAPEVIQNFDGSSYSGEAVDVWSCGVVLFIMLFGRHPFLLQQDLALPEPQQMVKLFQRVMQNEICFPPDIDTRTSPQCVDLVRRLLTKSPNERLTVPQIQRHPWYATALPEGAAIMNDLFVAEDALCLSPQSAGQIEALVQHASTAVPQHQLQQQQQALAAAAPPGVLYSGNPSPATSSGPYSPADGYLVHASPGTYQQSHQGTSSSHQQQQGGSQGYPSSQGSQQQQQQGFPSALQLQQPSAAAVGGGSQGYPQQHQQQGLQQQQHQPQGYPQQQPSGSQGYPPQQPQQPLQSWQSAQIPAVAVSSPQAYSPSHSAPPPYTSHFPDAVPQQYSSLSHPLSGASAEQRQSSPLQEQVQAVAQGGAAAPTRTSEGDSVEQPSAAWAWNNEQVAMSLGGPQYQQQHQVHHSQLQLQQQHHAQQMQQLQLQHAHNQQQHAAAKAAAAANAARLQAQHPAGMRTESLVRLANAAEAAVMSMPSSELLHAAMVDVLPSPGSNPGGTMLADSQPQQQHGGNAAGGTVGGTAGEGRLKRVASTDLPSFSSEFCLPSFDGMSLDGLRLQDGTAVCFDMDEGFREFGTTGTDGTSQKQDDISNQRSSATRYHDLHVGGGTKPQQPTTPGSTPGGTTRTAGGGPDVLSVVPVNADVATGSAAAGNNVSDMDCAGFLYEEFDDDFLMPRIPSSNFDWNSFSGSLASIRGGQSGFLGAAAAAAAAGAAAAGGDPVSNSGMANGFSDSSLWHRICRDVGDKYHSESGRLITAGMLAGAAGANDAAGGAIVSGMAAGGRANDEVEDGLCVVEDLQ